MSKHECSAPDDNGDEEICGCDEYEEDANAPGVCINCTHDKDYHQPTKKVDSKVAALLKKVTKVPGAAQVISKARLSKSAGLAKYGGTSGGFKAANAETNQGLRSQKTKARDPEVLFPGF
jgi:hypothetical protein